MRRTHLISALAILALAPAAWAVPDGPMPARNGAGAADQDPKTIARNSYNLGYQGGTERGEARSGSRVHAGLCQPVPRHREGTLATAQGNFRKAVAADPSMKEGWNMLGYTSRRLGEYQESLKAYEKALALSPNYPEAIEYRAELFLLTGRLDQTKEAYATLLKLEPSYAGVLKTSMQDFLKSKQAFPASVTSQQSEAFATWVNSL